MWPVSYPQWKCSWTHLAKQLWRGGDPASQLLYFRDNGHSSRILILTPAKACQLCNYTTYDTSDVKGNNIIWIIMSEVLMTYWRSKVESWFSSAEVPLSLLPWEGGGRKKPEDSLEKDSRDSGEPRSSSVSPSLHMVQRSILSTSGSHGHVGCLSTPGTDLEATWVVSRSIVHIHMGCRVWSLSHGEVSATLALMCFHCLIPALQTMGQG